MNKPVIVIDLDNVLAESAKGFVLYSNTNFGTAITLNDYSEDWQTMWSVSLEEAERRSELMLQNEMQRDYRTVAGATSVLTKLNREYKLIILTSRRKKSELYTKQWLQDQYPGIFCEIVFSGLFDTGHVGGSHLLTKGEQYRQLGASFVIDDNLKHCESATQLGIKAILFGDYPWNQSKLLPEGVARCEKWSDVNRYFDANHLA